MDPPNALYGGGSRTGVRMPLEARTRLKPTATATAAGSGGGSDLPDTSPALDATKPPENSPCRRAGGDVPNWGHGSSTPIGTGDKKRDGSVSNRRGATMANRIYGRPDAMEPPAVSIPSDDGGRVPGGGVETTAVRESKGDLATQAHPPTPSGGATPGGGPLPTCLAVVGHRAAAVSRSRPRPRHGWLPSTEANNPTVPRHRTHDWRAWFDGLDTCPGDTPESSTRWSKTVYSMSPRKRPPKTQGFPAVFTPEIDHGKLRLL